MRDCADSRLRPDLDPRALGSARYAVRRQLLPKMAQSQNGESSVLEVASEVQVENTPVSFSVGDIFPAFEQLEAKIKSYEEQNYVKFWKRDCRTIEAARKRVNRSLSDNIKYYEVTYCCIHGGKKFKARGEGKRSSM